MSHDLYFELREKTNMLDSAIRVLKTRGQAYAQAEHDYKVAMAQKMLIEREKGMPVTILGDICRGDKAIAKLRFERDVADINYKAALEAINVYKLQLRLIENQIQREWGNTSNQGGNT